MKTIQSFTLGALSSAFLSIGLTRAAQVCDPHQSHPALVAADEPISTLACEPPCYLAQS